MRLIAMNSLWVALIALFGAGAVRAQVEAIGGPYTKDANTMLLMHFDGNLANEADYSADGVGEGNYSFLSISADPSLGQSIRFDNDAISDSSYVWVADTSYLDLTGDWTLEGWINVFTFGETSGDHRWVPRLLIKTGDEVFWRPNYWIELWGDFRFFSSGYHTTSQDAWPQVNTPNNFAQPGQWIHITFIRDTARNLLVSMVHDANRTLINFNAVEYTSFAAADYTPISTSKPLHIGWAGGGGDSWLDGFIDEVRVSNSIRNFAVPPIITQVTQLENQPTSAASYEVTADIEPFSGTFSITSATLRYNDGSGWVDVPMSLISGKTYSGSIPQKPLGTVINYYIRGVDNNGSIATYPAAAEFTEPVYLSFGVYQPNTQTLQLTFEEGPGTPVDHSQYAQTVDVFGAPSYSADAKQGSSSLYFEGDSSYLEITSPFLASSEYTVDFWFKADTMIQFTRLINKPIDAGNWFQNNYEIRFEPNQTIKARFWNDDTDTYNEILLQSTLATGIWYHVIYEVSATRAGFELRDENDAFLEVKDSAVVNPPVLAGAPLRIGRAAGRPFFKGRMDNIQIYNYSAGLTAVEDGAGVPLQYALRQNYPNPFNPSTTIQFVVPGRQTVQLVVYDLLGRKVKTLVDKEMEVGQHTVTWDGRNEIGLTAASGLYFYRLNADKFVQVRKMLLLR